MDAKLEKIAKSRYFDVDSNTFIHYLDAGEGDPLIFFPGMAHSAECFINQIIHFSKTHRVIAIEPRGHGLSSKTPHGNNVRTHGEDAIALAEELDLKDVTLIGWSAGAQYAWEYCKQSDFENVKALVTIDLPPKETEGDDARLQDPDWWYEMNLADLSDFEAAFSNQAAYDETWRSYIQDVMIQHLLDEDELAKMMELRAEMPYWLCHDLLYSVEMADYTSVAQEAAKRIPYLIFAGDYWGDGRIERYTEKHLPGAQTSVFGGHMMFFEYPDRFNDRLDRFLKEIS